MQILITGGSGFLGAWLIRRLAAAGHRIRLLDINKNHGLVKKIASAAAAASIDWRLGDIVDASQVMAAAEGCDGIVHLAAILTPACMADPQRGARINILGTLNVFSAALALGIQRIVYTSSAAVYGPTDGHHPFPITHYGAFKLACEGSARAYWRDAGLASTGFRPYVVYGGGREVGMTAGPSLACRAAARGEAYEIPYRGLAGLGYVEDITAAFEAALLRQPDGAHVFNLVGEIASNDDVIAAIRSVVPRSMITAKGPDLPFAPDVDEGNLRKVLPGLPRTRLADGIRRTIEFYRETGG